MYKNFGRQRDSQDIAHAKGLTSSGSAIPKQLSTKNSATEQPAVASFGKSFSAGFKLDGSHEDSRTSSRLEESHDDSRKSSRLDESHEDSRHLELFLLTTPSPIIDRKPEVLSQRANDLRSCALGPSPDLASNCTVISVHGCF